MRSSFLCMVDVERIPVASHISLMEGLYPCPSLYCEMYLCISRSVTKSGPSRFLRKAPSPV